MLSVVVLDGRTLIEERIEADLNEVESWDRFVVERR
jgi:hypothetical protein